MIDFSVRVLSMQSAAVLAAAVQAAAVENSLDPPSGDEFVPWWRFVSDNGILRRCWEHCSWRNHNLESVLQELPDSLSENLFFDI